MAHLVAIERQDAQSISWLVRQPRVTQIYLHSDGVLVIQLGDVAEALAGHDGAEVGPALAPALQLGSCLLRLLLPCRQSRAPAALSSA
jgi:hypothetical protein